MDSSEATLKPGVRWDPAGYELNDSDFSELAEMFAEIRIGCDQNFNRYFNLLKRFVKLSLTNYELDLEARKFLSAELMLVHERFVNRILQICKLPVKTRSLEDILGGDDEKGSNDEIFLPHVSTLNALVIIYSLACSWSVPDRKVGELLAEAVHTMLKDRIDAALAVKNLSETNEIGIHARYQASTEDACPVDKLHIRLLISGTNQAFKDDGSVKASESSKMMEFCLTQRFYSAVILEDLNCTQATSAAFTLTAEDFLKSFSCKNHFLADESVKLLRLPSHSNFYKRLKSVVPEEQWDRKLEESLLNRFAKTQKLDESMDEQSSSTETCTHNAGNDSERKIGTIGPEKSTKHSNSSGLQTAKRKHGDTSVATSMSPAAIDVDQNV